jgi:DNA repair exonuclease SbcCD ATPase subunit
MILFKTIRWQNLLSTGNTWTEIRLNKSNATLIIGENGAGKSTILDALSFGLYGKPFRKINKPQLLNAINQKNLLVEVEFSIGKRNYLIRRGIKPTIFEIYQDNVMLNQNSESKEYQDILERSILKLNHKSFSQIVVLGSTTFVPFMQLTAAARREVIEDLLDIQIFTTMNVLLKEKISENKSGITDANHQISLIEQKIDLNKKHIESLKQNNEEIIDEKWAKIQENNVAIIKYTKEYEDIKKEHTELLDKILDESKVSKKITILTQMKKELEYKLADLKENVQFFHDNDTCPTCTQNIDHDFKEETLSKRNVKISDIQDGIEKITNDIKSWVTREKEIKKIKSKVEDLAFEILNKRNMRDMHKQYNIELNAEVKKLKEKNQKIHTDTHDQNLFADELTEKHKLKEDLTNERSLLDVAITILKDGGIKTRIIKQYIPVINKLINKYLSSMDFFVDFQLNESFEESIKSRFRDEFSYESFSEGEKMRIDLALLFTWRSIAKLRNSASTNLLIMDEVFDSSLDGVGTEKFLGIIKSLTKETNVFIISHKGDQLIDKFTDIIKFEKHKNFSRVAA